MTGPLSEYEQPSLPLPFHAIVAPMALWNKNDLLNDDVSLCVLIRILYTTLRCDIFGRHHQKIRVFVVAFLFLIGVRVKKD